MSGVVLLPIILMVQHLNCKKIKKKKTTKKLTIKAFKRKPKITR